MVTNNTANYTANYTAWLVAIGWVLAWISTAPAQSVSEQEAVKEALRVGDYDRSIAISKEQVEKRVWNEKWPATLIETYLTLGRYADAVPVLEDALTRFGDSLRIRLLAIQVYRMNNESSKAKEQFELIDTMVQRSPWRYTGSSELVPLGEYFLLRGEDPKTVLKACFDQAIKADPAMIDAHLATARMALSKNDAKVASQSLAKAIKLDEKSPEVHYLLAKTWSSTEPERATNHLKESLAINPRYVPSLLMVAEEKMNEEAYDAALEVLSEVEKVNPRLPAMWALRAAIAHLQGRYPDEGSHRGKALEPWALNPEVDHTIGKHLAMHYRFSESVDYQRRSLTMDARYVPAQTQLAQDLLRLGKTDDGWTWVDKVRTEDPYDVTIFNLKQLQKELDRFATLEAPGFVIRMDAREAKIYGQDVVTLLSQARKVLTEKYAVELEEPVYVEIFPKQKDFAIRTFGLPGGQGFLGVCFGRLITANSPAALQVDSNWQSVLWHEYCHVVTLQKTRNKMPRWLSEGISVYEERLRDKTWGQSMDPTYREMILGEDLVPLSKLSSAFLNAKSPMHVQFAYFESSLAVQFLIETYGMPAMLQLLDNLAIGMPADDALRRAPGSLEALDQEFEAFIKKEAMGLAPSADWSKPTGGDRAELEAWYQENPKSYYSIERAARGAIQNGEWEEALKLAKELETLWPEDHRSDGCHAMLSRISRELGNSADERTHLTRWLERSPDALDALLRVSDIDWKDGRALETLEWCERMQAVQPLRFDVQERRALSAEKCERWDIAEAAWKACMELDPFDIAWIEYRLAVALDRQGKSEEAKRHLLLALEESPRFTEALRMLVSMQTKLKPEKQPEPKKQEVKGR
jgi:tetratricopeptide (TPR) repeat protein